MAVPTPTRDVASAAPAARTATARRSEAQPELEDPYLVALAKRGSPDAYDRIVKRYRGFVRLKASSYFLLGGDPDDLIQEGLVGLYKAIRDFRSDRESSFRNFAELCITRQIITAVKTASRNKHAPLNSVRVLRAGAGRRHRVRDHPRRGAPGPEQRGPVGAGHRHRGAARASSPASRACCREFESHVLSLYLDGHSYEEIGERLECDTKTVDNALQRVKRKVSLHLASREATF